MDGSGRPPPCFTMSQRDLWLNEGFSFSKKWLSK
jgi:hypothetical protein